MNSINSARLSENDVWENAPSENCLRRKKTTGIIRMVTSQQVEMRFEATCKEGGDTYRSYFGAVTQNYLFYIIFVLTYCFL